MKFRKKPVVIDASQFWRAGDHPAVDSWRGWWEVDPVRDVIDNRFIFNDDGMCELHTIRTLEGMHGVTPGDWIITGVKGEHYPCKPDIFAATYEPVSDEPAWRAEKAAMDAADDGHGPYMHWFICSDEERAQAQALWRDFLAWASDNLGQGYSVACAEGGLLDQVTIWAFAGYMAGRNEAAQRESERAK